MQSHGPPPHQSLNHLTSFSKQQQQEQFLNQNLLHQQQQQQSNVMSTNSQNTPPQASPISHSVMQNTSIQHRFGLPQPQTTMQGGMVNPNPTPPDPAMQELMSKTPDLSDGKQRN